MKFSNNLSMLIRPLPPNIKGNTNIFKSSLGLERVNVRLSVQPELHLLLITLEGKRVKNFIKKYQKLGRKCLNYIASKQLWIEENLKKYQPNEQK